MKGGVKMDKMSLLVDMVEMENAEILRTYEMFAYLFEAGGHTGHGSNECLVCQCIIVTYINPESPQPVAEGPEEMVGVREGTEGTGKVTVEVQDKGNKGKSKHRASKKRKIEESGDLAVKCCSLSAPKFFMPFLLPLKKLLPYLTGLLTTFIINHIQQSLACTWVRQKRMKLSLTIYITNVPQDPHSLRTGQYRNFSEQHTLTHAPEHKGCLM
ncbi:hypothetical protein V8E55_008493 [Tylopilus felleus]